jgi:Predicted transcriptional regulators
MSAERGHAMTQTEFAAYLGLKVAQYNRYENQQQQPTLETAFRIARRLGVKVDDLFTAE